MTSHGIDINQEKRPTDTLDRRTRRIRGKEREREVPEETIAAEQIQKGGRSQ